MTIKTNGAEYKRFYADPKALPEGAWHEDEELIVNGNAEDQWELDVQSIPDRAEIKLSGGAVYDHDGKDIGTLESFFKKWKKAQTHMTLVVDLPTEQEAAFREAIKAFKAKVI